MALVVKDRVQETATLLTSTGAFQLAGAVTGYQAFTTIGNTNTTYYSATDVGGRWEVGIGTYATGSPNTLTRTTILSSSNTNAIVTTFSGTITVFCTYPSSQAVYEDEGNAIIPGVSGAIYLTAQTITQNTTVPTGYNGIIAGSIQVANGVTFTVADGSTAVVVA
jgi:hypothetical protein